MEELHTIPSAAWDDGDPYLFNIGDLGIDLNTLPLIPRDREVPAFEQLSIQETAMACTIVNARRQFCYTANHPFTVEEMLKVVNFCVTEGGYVIGQGRGTPQAMNYVSKYIAKTYPELSVIYGTFSPADIPTVFNKNQILGFTYRGNNQWDKDRADGILEGISYIPMNYGHRSIIKFNNGIMVDDSFVIKNYTISHYAELIKSGNIYSPVYLWVMKTTDNTAQIKKLTRWKVTMQRRIEDDKKILSDPVYQTTDQQYRLDTQQDLKLSQTKLDYVMGELKKIGL